jgi:hypothetical protein
MHVYVLARVEFHVEEKVIVDIHLLIPNPLT